MTERKHGEGFRELSTQEEVALDLVINNVLLYGQLNVQKTAIVFEDYSIGRMGAVYKGNKPIGHVENWGASQRKKYGLV